MTAIRGVIDRRILINFRVDPDALEQYLPEPFKPKLVSGFGVAGVCLIRLKQIRPSFMPPWAGVGSENAAHRIAVIWRTKGETDTGVYIPRRDSDSRLNTLVGGRLFPGVHHHATFEVAESEQALSVSMVSDDGEADLSVKASVADTLPSTSIFSSVTEASSFFEEGAVGYSPSRTAGEFEGLELRTLEWRVAPLHVEHVESTFFSRVGSRFERSAEFDCALLMTGVDHHWHSRESLYCDWPT